MKRYLILTVLGFGLASAPILSAQNVPGSGWSSWGVLPFKGVDYRIFKTPGRYIMYYVKNGFPTPDASNGGQGRAFSTDLKTWTVDSTNFCPNGLLVPMSGVTTLPDGRIRLFNYIAGTGTRRSSVTRSTRPGHSFGRSRNHRFSR